MHDRRALLALAVGNVQVTDVEYGIWGGAHRVLLPMDWLMRLADRTTATTIRPGAAVSHQAVAR
ncbi:hypothetical protein D3C87_1776520 [compost metagenome]